MSLHEESEGPRCLQDRPFLTRNTLFEGNQRKYSSLHCVRGVEAGGVTRERELYAGRAGLKAGGEEHGTTSTHIQ